jgi:hypothetical protein
MHAKMGGNGRLLHVLARFDPAALEEWEHMADFGTLNWRKLIFQVVVSHWRKTG